MNRKRKFPFSNGPFSKPTGSSSFGLVSEWSYVSLLSNGNKTCCFWPHFHRLKWEKQPDLVNRMGPPPVANFKHLTGKSTKMLEISKIVVVHSKILFVSHSESTSATLWQVWRRLEIGHFMHASQLHPVLLTTIVEPRGTRWAPRRPSRHATWPPVRTHTVLRCLN